MSKNRGECIAEIGSMTQAMRAQGALAEMAIPSTIVKTNSSKSNKGCAYGLSVDCNQMENAENVFDRTKVRVRKWKSEN